jgi:hypothetical protein
MKIIRHDKQGLAFERPREMWECVVRKKGRKGERKTGGDFQMGRWGGEA